MPKRYEHKVIYVPLSRHESRLKRVWVVISSTPKEQWPEITELEAEDWELVTAMPVIVANYHEFTCAGYSYTQGLYLFFKRPVG